MDYIIDSDVQDWFDDISKLASMLNLKSKFSAPCPIEKIIEWEKENNIKLPDQYKSWLLLTSDARIIGGEINIFFPQIVSYHEDAVMVGDQTSGSDHLFFSKETGDFYDFGDYEEEYEDFCDLLTSVYMSMEDEAEEEYGEDWLDIYKEKFGE